MSLIKRQVFKSAISSYSGIALAFVSRLFFFPLLLLPEQIGLLEVILSVSTLIMPFITLGTHQTIIKFHPYFKENNTYNTFKGAMYFFSFFAMFLLLLFSLVFPEIIDSALLQLDESGKIIQYKWLIFLCAVSLVLNAIQRSVASVFGRISIPDFLKEFVLRFEFLVLLILLFYDVYDFELFIKFYFISYLSIVIFTELYIIKMEGFPAMFSIKDLAILRKLKAHKYALYNILNSLSGMIVQHIDKVMVASLIGLAGAGIYSIAFYIGVLVELPLRSTSKISAPIIAKAWKDNNRFQINSLYQKTSNFLALIGSLAFITVAVNISDLFMIIPNGEIYKEGLYVVIIIALAKWINLCFGLNFEIISVSDKYPFAFYSSLLLGLITILTNYFFIPLYGISGAALASLLTLIIINLIRFLFLYYYFDLQPFSNQTLKILIVSVAVLVLAYVIPTPFHPFFSILIRIAVIFPTYLIFVYWLKIDEGLNKKLKSLMLKINDKIK